MGMDGKRLEGERDGGGGRGKGVEVEKGNE